MLTESHKGRKSWITGLLVGCATLMASLFYPNTVQAPRPFFDSNAAQADEHTPASQPTQAHDNQYHDDSKQDYGHPSSETRSTLSRLQSGEESAGLPSIEAGLAAGLLAWECDQSIAELSEDRRRRWRKWLKTLILLGVLGAFLVVLFGGVNVNWSHQLAFVGFLISFWCRLAPTLATFLIHVRLANFMSNVDKNRFH